MAEALIGLGGNIGDVRTVFRQAIAQICAATPATLLARSSDYRTPPWGETDQPPFINACIAIETAAAPDALLTVLQDTEARFGRNRATEQRWGPRRLDLDLIAYDDVNLKTERLILPHPRLFERAFVLVPLAEIAPLRQIAGKTVREALAGLSTDGIERLPR